MRDAHDAGKTRRGARLLRAMAAVDRALIGISLVLLITMVAITFVSTIGRTFFSQAVPDDILISEIFMVAIVFLPLGYVQSLGAHLEVTVLTDRFSVRTQERLVAAGLILGILFIGLMTYFTSRAALDSFLMRELAYASVLEIPEWWGKLLIPVGLAWWCVRMIVQLLVPRTRPPLDHAAGDGTVADG